MRQRQRQTEAEVEAETEAEAETETERQTETETETDTHDSLPLFLRSVFAPPPCPSTPLWLCWVTRRIRWTSPFALRLSLALC